MKKYGKKYREALTKYDSSKLYEPKEALKIVKEIAFANFDETVEAAIRLGIDPTKADQRVRSTVVLPNGTGKSVRVLVFAKGEKAKEAEAAGADYVGAEDIAEKITKEGWLDFEAVIATPDMMSVVGKLGRILGPRGLMPNPKVGTVTFDIAKAVKEAKAGRVEFRADRYGILHVGIGKVSFELDKLAENFAVLLDAVVRARPQAAKGRYLKSIAVAPTMGPGVKVDPLKVRDFIEEIGIS